MFERYLLCLFKQYCDARGLDKSNTSNMYSNDFADWIAQNRSLLNNYMDYLHYLGFDSYDDIAEIGKGKYDSIFPNATKIISMFAETLGRDNSRLFISNGMPLIIRKSGIIVPREHTLLTHNPYFEGEIFGWDSIHNAGDKDISIGMFGKLDDEDVFTKINLLEQLSKQMADDYSFDYDTSEGNYFCSLNSNRHIKKKILIKTR